MTEAALHRSLCIARDAMTTWMDRLPANCASLLRTEVMAKELTRLSYVDGYLRIRHTLPLILSAIERLDALGRRREAAFWIEHLREEAFHDRVMRDDLARLLGGSRKASAALRKARMTPSSAALIGYFQWQVSFGNPSLLIALRLFLEWYMGGLEDWRISSVNSLLEGGSRIMTSHTELDVGHAQACVRYIEEYCRVCLKEVAWSVEFAGRCLADSQLHIAHELRERNP